MKHDATQHWVKRYKIVLDALWTEPEFIVVVDHQVVTQDHLRQLNDFWSGADDLRRAYGSDLQAVLRRLGLVLVQLMLEGLNRDGVVARFSAGIEGWPPMDGSVGWTIESTDAFDLDHSDISVSECAK